MKYDVFVSTNVGYAMKNNEDNFAINTEIKPKGKNNLNLRGYGADEPMMCSVFDGMGGEANGDIASHICAVVAVEFFKYITNKNISAKKCINQFVENCNTLIQQNLKNNKTKRGGSTFVMSYFYDNKIQLFSLGDSRIYLLRDNHLTQISNDHTLAMKKYLANIYSWEEAEKSPDKHKLTQFLGVDMDECLVKAEVYQDIKLNKGDKLLLCSDGLYDMCMDYEIEKIMIDSSDKITSNLVKKALENGGQDNITCMVIEPSL